MNAIRVKRKIESDTLHIPELRSMMGREVEIIVLEDRSSSLDGVDPQAFWKGKTVDELAKEQKVVVPYKAPDPPPFTAEDFEGFDEWLAEVRGHARRTPRDK